MSHRPKRIKYFQSLTIAMMLVFPIIAHGCKAKATEPAVKPNSSGKIVVGYYFNFQNGYDLGNIMYGNLTHIAHAFGIPNSNGTLNIDGISSQISGFARTVHQNNKKAVLSVGGWSGSSNFSGVAADSNKRHAFASALKAFCLSNNYDGVDIDWEYPFFRERTNVTRLIQEIGDSLRAGTAHFTISITIPYSIGGTGFSIADLESHLDWIGVMTYDYSTCASLTANDNAPLSRIESDIAALLATASPEKLLLGIPFYGRQYHCPSGPSIGALVDGCIDMPFSMLPDFSQGGWQRRWDTTSSVPYLINQSTNQLISYDDQQSIQSKCQWLKGKKLGGAIVWALGQDRSGSAQPLLCTVGLELLGNYCKPPTDSDSLKNTK
ncbi:MAG TPA: glycoside hydrolase family 18 protein [Bacteroidota bacterium]|nr:glycoside hydrolase family 18 protein [Bacteroidota bacterium]